MKRILQESFFRRLHTLLLLAVMFVVGGSARAENWQTIYANALSSIEGLTIINNNEDQSTWQADPSGGYVQYSYSGAWYAADDYMIFPAHALVAGKNYRISFEYATFVDWGPEHYAVKYGTNNTVAAQTNTIIDKTEVNVSNFTSRSETFTVRESGDIYISIVALSEYNKGYLKIKNFKLEVDEDSGAGGGEGGGDSSADQPDADYSFTQANLPAQNGISVIYYYWNYYQCANPYSSRPMSFTSNGKNIAKIELEGSNLNLIVNQSNFTTYTSSKIVWEGSASTVSFSSNDSNGGIVKTAKVWLEKDLDPIDYTVHLINAPGDATITVAGAAGTYGNNAHVSIAKHLTESDITATYDGYKTSVEVSGTDINVTYTEKGAITDDVVNLRNTDGNGITSEEELFEVSATGQTISNANGAIYYENGTFTVTSNSNITEIVLVNGMASNYPFSTGAFTATPTGDISSTASEFTWRKKSDAVGETHSVTFTVKRNQAAVVAEVRVSTAALAPTDYTVTFTGETVPDGAAVTIDGTQYTPNNNTFSTTKALNLSSATNVYENDDYYATVAYNEGNHTFTVTYYAYTKYSVAVAEDSEYKDAEAGVVVSGATYGNGTYLVGTNNIKSKGALQQSNFAAKEVTRYDGTVTLEGNTVTVKYTAKVVPPFSITQFDPNPSSSMNALQRILLYAPSGKTFVLEDTGRQIDLTFTNAETSAQQTVKAKYLCTYEGYVQLAILQQYGANYYTGSFSQTGTWGVTIPAGTINATDGSTNNAANVSYTIVASAQQTGANPANNTAITNNDIISGSFAINFDKNINSYEEYKISVQFPDNSSMYLNAISGLNVSINESSVVFSPTHIFWDTYASKLRQNGTLRFSIEMNALTDVNGITNAMPAQVQYNYTYVAPESAVTRTSPDATRSLDDYPSGYNQLAIEFANKFTETVNIASSATLPAGITLTLPAGVARGAIQSDGYKTLYINLNNGNVAGDYRVEIAKGTFNFENETFGQGVNAAVDHTWTLTAATKFSVSTWEEVSPRETVKSLERFTVSAPDGMTFVEPTNANVVLSVREGYEGEAADVTATMSLEEGSMVFTFPTAYSSKGSIFVTVPAGAISTTDGLTSKEFEASFNVDPFDYFDFVSTVPAANSNVNGPVNTITLTLPEGKTVKTVGESINVNGVPVTVSSHDEDGNDVVLHLATALPYSRYNTINIPEAFIVTTDDALSNNLIYYNVYVNKLMMYTRATVGGETTTTNSVTVEKFQSIEVYFDEESDYTYGVPSGVTLMKGEEPITITNGWNSAYSDVTYKYGSYYFMFSEISAPGTYTLHIPAGVFTSVEGNQNEEVNLEIVIPTPEYFAAMTVSPEDGKSMESLKTIILTAPADVTFDDVKGLQGRVTVNEDTYYPNNIEFADDKKSVTFNISEKTTDGEYAVTFPAGFVRSTDGKWSLPLTATYTVNYPWFTLSSSNVTPATGEVAAINGITIAAPEGVVFAAPAANVTIVVNGVDTQVGASLNEGKIVLAYNATKADRYEIRIPASTFTNVGATKANKELTGLNYTIQPTLSIKDYSVDDNGNHWTTFCLNKSFTLEDGYTPYILRDNGEGGVKLVEVLGTPIIDTYNCYFNSSYGDATEHTGHDGTINSTNIAGKYQVTYETNQTYDEYYDLYDITNSFKHLVFTIKVLEGAKNPSNAGAHYYNPTVGTKVSSRFEQISEDTYTVTVEAGDGASHVGGIFIEVPTGTYNAPIIRANTGILVKGDPKNGIVYTHASGTEADVSGNLLRGCTQSAVWESDEEVYYKLSWKAGDGYEDLGFYWDVDGGHSMRANSGKAYLVLNAEQASNKSRMLIFGGHDEETTIIDSVETDMDNAPIYNLQGKPVSREHLPAGIYIKNGRKFIVR